jgi:hypothetical protein
MSFYGIQSGVSQEDFQAFVSVRQTDQHQVEEHHGLSQLLDEFGFQA